MSASATWKLVDNIAAVFITVLMETGRGGEVSSIGATLNSYNMLRGAGRSPIIVVSGKRKYVAVSVEYDLKPGFRDDLVKPEIMRALGVNYAKPASEEDQTGLFSVNRQRFGGSGYASSIEGTVQNVEGVLWAKTTAFATLVAQDEDDIPEDDDDDPKYDDPNNISLPSDIALITSISCDSVHILSLYDKHLSLKENGGKLKMTRNNRVKLYRRLPEIYRIKDEGLPDSYFNSDGGPVEAYQLRSYLEPVEQMFSAIHENIESLYHDLFIETCDEWVVPYIADLMGASHLSGDAWTLRADVADTIALRRRKGTLGAIELLSFILTKWGVHTVELRENMVWNQHLNHQRPDEAGIPPYSLPSVRRQSPVRGGTVSLRDPSLLALLNKPFDPFAHVADVRPHEMGQVRYNLPNLAIYLWRLKAYRLAFTRSPYMKKVTPTRRGAPYVVRVNIDPVSVNNPVNPYLDPVNAGSGRPVRLFNTNRFELFGQNREGSDQLNLSSIAPRVSTVDQVPGPVPVERISDLDIAKEYDDSLNSPNPRSFEEIAAASYTAPHDYVAVDTYDENHPGLDTLDLSDVGLQLHLPNTDFPDETWLHRALPRNWTLRGEDLCAWEERLQPPLADKEIAIDPVRGRICIGVSSDARADALLNHLLLTFTYGAVGEVGAHPISYPALPADYDHNFEPSVIYKTVNIRQGKPLQQALEDALKEARDKVQLDPDTLGKVPIVIEITDSRAHPLDTGALPAADCVNIGGKFAVKLNAPLIIRASDEQRPIVELARPLGFCPANVVGANQAEQLKFDAAADSLFVRLEGLYLARKTGYPAADPIIERAALNKLEIMSCTLDPGGFRYFNGARAQRFPGLKLSELFGFATAEEEQVFKQTPEIVIQRSVCGAIFTAESYRLCLTDSIIESVPVSPPGALAVTDFAISGTDPIKGYGGHVVFNNITVLGRARAASVDGSGGIFTGVLEAFDQQSGCLKYCYFAEDAIGKLKNHPAPEFRLRERQVRQAYLYQRIFRRPGLLPALTGMRSANTRTRQRRRPDGCIQFSFRGPQVAQFKSKIS